MKFSEKYSEVPILAEKKSHTQKACSPERCQEFDEGEEEKVPNYGFAEAGLKMQ
jgi:hypothetical protein